MKAYQLKAAVKNQKPPIWRRIVVPAGITYSQLSLVLAEVMEKTKEEDFEFEFYQKKIRFGENGEGKQVRKNFFYSTAEASEFYIDELFDTEDWFSFYYGEDLKLRVTIEKRVNVSFCPFIVKAVDRLLVDSETEQAEKKDDFKEKLLRLNEELKKKYQVQYGGPENKKAWQIRKDHQEGRYGLTGWEEARNDPQKISHSAGYHLELLGDILTAYQEGGDLKELKSKLDQLHSETTWQEPSQGGVQGTGKEKNGRISLKELLHWGTKQEILELGQELGVTVSSSLSKDKAVQKVAGHMVKPDVLKDYFIKLDDERIQAWDNAVTAKKYYKPSEEEWEVLEPFYDDFYLAMYNNGTVEVPFEVAEEYNKMNTPEFEERRKQVTWMMDCLYIHTTIYGVAPASVVMRMYRKRPGYRLKQSEFLSVFQDIPKEYNPCVLYGDKVIRKAFAETGYYEKLERIQEPWEFFIPEADEIRDCCRNGYPSRERHYGEIRTFLTEKCSMDGEDVKEWLAEIWQWTTQGYSVQEIEKQLKGEGLVFGDKKKRKEFLDLLNKAQEYTRCLRYRGNRKRDCASGNCLTNNSQKISNI